MAGEATSIERLLRRERAILLAGLLVICALAWLWVVAGAGTGMSTVAMTTWQFPPPMRAPMVAHWSSGYAMNMLLMWWVMMIAMMVPSAAPVILLYARVYRFEQRLGRLAGGTAPAFAFALGYLACWAFFSAIATALQWSLERAGLVHGLMMWSIDSYFAAALLIAAGLYQLTPLKKACLAHCRSPAQYLAMYFTPGARGAFRLGLNHGAYCLGCCWVLMALLFAGGIMNLVWIAGLAVYVLIEKVVPGGQILARVAGVGLVLAGVGLVVNPAQYPPP